MSKLRSAVVKLWPQLEERIIDEDENSLTYSFDITTGISYRLAVNECGRVLMQTNWPAYFDADLVAQAEAYAKRQGTHDMARLMETLLEQELWRAV